MARILLVDDDFGFTSATKVLLEAEGHNVEVASCVAEAKSFQARHPLDLMFVDLSLPDGSGLELIHEKGPQTVIITGHPSFKTAIRAVRGRVIDYLVKPLEREQLLASIQSALKLDNGTNDKRNKSRRPPALIGESPPMVDLFRKIADFASTDVPIIVTGESGTGKDLVAQSLHHVSKRDGPFMPLNCGVIPRDLIASELFGHEKGAFTGANANRKGLFERAGKGTVFLDEVGELSLEHQVALLRVLEDHAIFRVGGDEEVPIHCRVVAATNCQLDAAVRKGTFREDLYFRLMVLPIEVPPLRDRKDDLQLLTQHFLRQFAVEHNTQSKIAPDVLKALAAYHWPGNVRELKHTLLRMALLNRGKDVIDELPSGFGRPLELGQDQKVLHPGMSIKDVEKTLIEKTLTHYKGNKTQTAEALGISLKTLYNRLNEYGYQEGAVAE